MDELKSHRWLRKIMIFIFSSVFLITGCGKKNKAVLTETELKRIAFAQRPIAPDTLMVSGEKITCDDIAKMTLERNGSLISLEKLLEPVAKTSTSEQFKEQARPQVQHAVMGKVSNILLYQQAKRQAGDKIDQILEKAVDKEWKKFILRFGADEAKAEDELRQMGLDRQSFKEHQRKGILTQSYIVSKIPDDRLITHNELVECYNKMKDEYFLEPAMLRFRLIDIEPAKLQIADPNQDRREQAIWLAMDLLRRIETGEDFGELAKQYSHGHRSEFGGLWKPREPDSLAPPYDILAREAKSMEPGQVTGLIEVAEHIFIMKLEEKRNKGYEPLEKVQAQVEQKIIADRRKEAIDKLNDELMQQAALGDTSLFAEVCLDKIYRNSNQ
jgi:parvulin-like peptidyl-prolyl isomerase